MCHLTSFIDFSCSRARDPSPMTRVNPADASATIGVVIAQITSTDILTCIQALAQVTYTQNHVFVLDFLL